MRYNKLSEIWSKYKFEDIIRYGEGIKPKNSIYFIPELVLEDYITQKVYLTHEVGAWVARNKENILLASMHLTEEDYYLLLVKQTNDYNDIPLCEYCGAKLNYNYRFNIGYYETCNRSCNASKNLEYQYSHPEEYPSRQEHLLWCIENNLISWDELWKDPDFRKMRLESLHQQHQDIDFRIKFDISRFISSGEPDDICELFISKNTNGVYLGLSSDLESRLIIEPQLYSGIEIIRTGTRLKLANLKSQVLTKMHSLSLIEHSRYTELIELINLLDPQV